MKPAQKTAQKVIGHVFASAFFIAIAAGSFYLFYTDLTGTMSKLNEQPIATVAIKDKLVQRHFADRLVWDQLRTGSAVYNGDVLRTADLSGVAVVFVNDSSLELGENSMAQVFYSKEGVSVDVAGGKVNAIASAAPIAAAAPGAGKIVITSGGQSVSVDSGSAVSTVVKNDGSMNVQVQQGTANIQKADGATAEVKTGETVAITTTAEPVVAEESAAVEASPAEPAAVSVAVVTTPPTAIPVSPVNNEVLSFDWNEAGTAPVEFNWETNNYGEGEKTVLQIAEDRRFTKLVTGGASVPAAEGENTYTGKNASRPLRSGEYWWRVMPRSTATGTAAGAEFAEARKFSVTIAKPPEPPPPPPPPPREATRLTLTPVRGELYEGGSMPRLRWESREKAANGFRVIIAKDNDPAKAADEGRAIWDITTTGTSLALPALNSGDYWWTVLARAQDGFDISAASAETFSVVPMPPLASPGGLEPVRDYRIDREQLRRDRGRRLSWTAVPGANAYVVTVWKDSPERPLIRTIPLRNTYFVIADLVEMVRPEIASAAVSDSSSLTLEINWQVEAVVARSNGIIDRPGTPARSRFVVEIDKPRSPELIIDDSLEEATE